MELLRVSPRDPRAWKAAVDTLSPFLNEVVLHFTEEGMWLQALDPSMVLFVSMEAPKSAFSEYELKYPEVRVPISMADYHRVLSRLGPGDRLTMSFSSTNLYVVMEGSGVRKEFVLPALDVRESQPTVTMPSSAVRIGLPSSLLKEALKNAAVVSRHVTFYTSEEGLVVEAREGSSVSRTVVRPGPGIMLEFKGHPKSTYSLEYLQAILKGAEGEVRLEYGEDSPLRVHYTIGDVKMEFVLAPLIL